MPHELRDTVVVEGFSQYAFGKCALHIDKESYPPDLIAEVRWRI